MPRLLLFAPCERVIVEQGANTVSLIALLQGLTLHHTEPTTPDAAIQQRWYVLSIWLKEPGDDDHQFQQRITFVAPSGRQAIEAFTDFTMTKEFQRNVAQFQAFPVGEEGHYDLRLEFKRRSDENWTMLASYPLSVTHVPHSV